MRRFLVIALVVMCCGSAFAAANGSCTGTTSCTLSGTPTARSLQIAFSYRSGSTTAPTLITGWTSVSTGTGTTSSWRLQCRVSATAASGTATNATNMVAIWYSGTDANATANCNTTGIGSFGGTSAAGTTVTYPTRALTIPNNMVVGFMGGSASSVCTPTGMTQIATLGTVAAADTVQPTSSWPTTTCTVSSENNSGVTVEVMMTNDGLSGQSTSVWPVDYYIDMQGNTTLADDTTPLCTAGVCTPMVNGTHTIKANTWSASNGGTLTGLNVSRYNGGCPRNYDYYVRGGGFYSRTRPWRSIRIDHGNTAGTGAATGINAQLAIPANTPNVSITYCIFIGAQACDGGIALVDYVQPQGALTGHSSTVQFDCGQGVTPAQPAFNVESNLDGTTKHGNTVRAKPGTFVRVVHYVDYTTGLQKARFWDPFTLAFLGESSIQVTVTPETVGNINLGNTEFYTTASCTGCQGNTYSYIEDIGIDITNATYPPLPTEQDPWWLTSGLPPAASPCTLALLGAGPC
jgi:hypothetical protein